MNKENTLKQLKILLGIADDTKDTLLMIIIDNMAKAKLKNTKSPTRE